jgi:hypothetical protein
MAASHGCGNIGLLLSIIYPAVIKTNLTHVENTHFLGELEAIAGIKAHLP